ncbi:MAG: histidinol-phosphatase [Bacteroidota bacterium]
MRYFNFHTHTRFCDGSSNPEEYVVEAISLSFESLGFSGHAPVPFDNGYAIKDEDLETYCETILALKEKYKELNIYLALETDYIPNITKDFAAFKEECKLDYVIGSVHLVSNPDKKGLWFIDGAKIETYDEGLNTLFGGDIKKAVTAYYHQVNEMITTQRPDVVGHVDKIKMNNKNRYFSIEDKWYTNLVAETLNLIKENGCIVEINSRGIYKKRSDETFPGTAIINDLFKMNIPVTISSDAHKPTELALLFNLTKEVLQEIGFKTVRVFDGKSWVEKEIY